MLPIALVSAVLASVPLLARSGPARLPIPLGPPGLPVSLAFDPLCGIFVPLAMIGIAAAASRRGPAADAERLLAPVGTLLVFLLAGDACLIAVMSALVLLAFGAGPMRAVLSLVCLALALVPLVPASPEAFGDLASPGGTAIATTGAPVLVCLATLAFALPRRRRAAQAAPGGAASAVLPLLGCGIAIRLGLGPAAASVAPGAPLLILPLGLALLLRGAAGAIAAERIERVFLDLDLAAIGLVLAAVGTAGLVHRADLAPVAAAALGGGILMLAARAILVPLAGLVVEAIAAEAGTTRLAGLGGLAAAAPRLSILALVALAGPGLLPPLAGFASVWLLAGTLIAVARQAGLPLQSVAALCLVSLGLSAGLLLAALLRVVAVAWLGRPRTPRGAAAVEPAPPVLRPAILLAGLFGALCLLPGPVLAAAAPALRALTGSDLGGTVSWLSIGVLPNGARCSPPMLLAALAVAPCALRLARRRIRAEAPREVPPWDDGAPPPPDWLPFGDPHTQAQASTLSAATASLFGIGPATVRRRLSTRLARQSLAQLRPLALLPDRAAAHWPLVLALAAFAGLAASVLQAPPGALQ